MTRYTWGGKSPATGFDCSGFVQYVFSQFGYTTSSIANDVRDQGVHVDPSDIQPGDVLCFYSGNNYVGHVGIYIGDNTFVHAANSDIGVVTTSLSVGYYAQRGYEIRRFGPSDRDRTCGLMVPNHARYQLRHTRKSQCIITQKDA